MRPKLSYHACSTKTLFVVSVKYVVEAPHWTNSVKTDEVHIKKKTKRSIRSTKSGMMPSAQSHVRILG